MPQIYEDGSTSVVGGIDVRFNHYENPFTEEKNFQLQTNNYTIHSADPTIQKLEGGFEIEGGLYQQEVKVKFEIEKRYYDYINEAEFEKRKEEAKKPIQISLLGTQTTLQSVQRGKILAVSYEGYWTSKKPFALLLEDTGEKGKAKDFYWQKIEANIYNRLGLVELGNAEKLKGGVFSKIIIKANPSEQYQAQIEHTQPFTKKS